MDKQRVAVIGPGSWGTALSQVLNDNGHEVRIWGNIAEQIKHGNRSIIGMMVESHLKGGRQDLTADLSQLEYGKSITDGCIDWDTTVKAMHDLRDAIKDVLPTRELND